MRIQRFNTARVAAMAVLTAAGLVLPAPSAHAAASDGPGSIVPAALRCEYQNSPIALETTRPRFAWLCRAVDDGRRGLRQTAFEILVASSQADLDRDVGDLWASGKVVPDQSVHVAYTGRPLKPRAQCFWKVRLWDQDGRPSPWSAPASFRIGLLAFDDWRARWIAGAASPRKDSAAERPALPLFRREFDVAKPVRRAMVYVCGLGQYELSLDGRRVGDQVLDPGWTNYGKTCLYAAYDITDRLAPGRHALGVMLGNGMYNVTGGRYVKFTGSFGPPKMILRLEIEQGDGTSSAVVSDGSWRTAAGPIVFSCTYGGEDYDARRELPGWDRPGFNDSAWSPPRLVDGPGGVLRPQQATPIKIIEEFRPVRTSEPRPGVFVYDLGRNFSGWPRLTVRGPAGATVRLIPGELLDGSGLVSQKSSGSPVWFAYTLRGEGNETWSPRFSYYGFRYVQVEGAVPDETRRGQVHVFGERSPANPALLSQKMDQSPGLPRFPASPALLSRKMDRSPDVGAAALPRVLDLRGEFLHNSAPVVGQFECSDPLINRIHALINAAIQSNLQSVITDCPHREKLGWLEVSHLLARGIMYNYDVARLYAKISQDMAESQIASGLVPDIAPEYKVCLGGFRDSPEWGSASLLESLARVAGLRRPQPAGAALRGDAALR